MVEHAAIVFVHVQARGEGNLAKVGKARGALAFFFGATEGRKQQGGENSDDGDHDKQFDQGEALFRKACGFQSHHRVYIYATGRETDAGSDTRASRVTGDAWRVTREEGDEGRN